MERSKDKDKSKTKKDKDSADDPPKAKLAKPRRSEEDEYHLLTDTPLAPPTPLVHPSTTSLGGPHTSGWSSVLEDWLCKGRTTTEWVLPASPVSEHRMLPLPPSPTPSRSPSLPHPSLPASKTNLVPPSPRRMNTFLNGHVRSHSHSNGHNAWNDPNSAGPYVLVAKERLMGIYLAIYVHRETRPLVRGVSRSSVTAGLIGGRFGNKGGVGISMNIAGRSFLFINAHLAAHEGRQAMRIENMEKIQAELRLDHFGEALFPRKTIPGNGFVEDAKPDITDQFDYTFVFGDLNFRLDVSRLHADWLISRHEYLRAQEFDELRNNMRSNKLFPGFEEPVLDFPPTFKYDVPKSRHHHHHHHHHHHSRKDKDGKEKDRGGVRASLRAARRSTRRKDKSDKIPKSPNGVPKPLRPLAEQCESAGSSSETEDESDMDSFTSSHPHSQSQPNLNFGGRKQQRPPSTRSQPTTLPGSASESAGSEEGENENESFVQQNTVANAQQGSSSGVGLGRMLSRGAKKGWRVLVVKSGAGGVVEKRASSGMGLGASGAGGGGMDRKRGVSSGPEVVLSGSGSGSTAGLHCDVDKAKSQPNLVIDTTATGVSGGGAGRASMDGAGGIVSPVVGGLLSPATGALLSPTNGSAVGGGLFSSPAVGLASPGAGGATSSGGGLLSPIAGTLTSAGPGGLSSPSAPALSNAGGLAPPPPMIRANSSGGSSMTIEGVGGPEEGESVKGVYDTSSKQRVPSWCDRIVYKSTVLPPQLPPSLPLPHFPPPLTDEDSRFGRVGNILTGMRRRGSRGRKDSFPLPRARESKTREALLAETRASPFLKQVEPEDVGVGAKPVVGTRPGSSGSAGRRRPGSSGTVTAGAGGAGGGEAQPASMQWPRTNPFARLLHPNLHGQGQGQGQNQGPGLIHAVSMEPEPQPPAGLDLVQQRPRSLSTSEGMEEQPSSPAAPPAKDDVPRWWFFNRPRQSIIVPPEPEPEPEPVVVEERKRGDIVCISYGTLDDKAMQRLGGRSDHRPVLAARILTTTTTATMAKVENKVCLIVHDGWGVSEVEKGNAVFGGDTTNMDGIGKAHSYRTLQAHGLAVGLSDGLMGNSEVGHLNIGAGRIVWQDIVRIDVSIKKREFHKNKTIVESFQHAKSTSGRVHLLGLVSDGGVHSHISHLKALLETAKEVGVPKAIVHFIGDGRDTAPRSSDKYLKELLEFIEKEKYGEVGTVVGRYYAMDRDKRWERVKIAIDGLMSGEGEQSSDPVATVEERYKKDETDEFLKPIIIGGEETRIKDKDTLFFFNYRSDRMREIVSVFGLDDKPMEVVVPKNLHITTMSRYNSEFPFNIAFPPQAMTNVLAEWLAKKGLKQCHIAETEKYAHVTFFFNGG
ncbi:hypothetical protein FRC09_011311, partial [Ceratobasidium sp. 395]